MRNLRTVVMIYEFTFYLCAMDAIYYEYRIPFSTLVSLISAAYYECIKNIGSSVIYLANL